MLLHVLGFFKETYLFSCVKREVFVTTKSQFNSRLHASDHFKVVNTSVYVFCVDVFVSFVFDNGTMNCSVYVELSFVSCWSSLSNVSGSVKGSAFQYTHV